MIVHSILCQGNPQLSYVECETIFLLFLLWKLCFYLTLCSSCTGRVFPTKILRSVSFVMSVVRPSLVPFSGIRVLPDYLGLVLKPLCIANHLGSSPQCLFWHKKAGTKKKASAEQYWTLRWSFHVSIYYKKNTLFLSVSSNSEPLLVGARNGVGIYLCWIPPASYYDKVFQQFHIIFSTNLKQIICCILCKEGS